MQYIWHNKITIDNNFTAAIGDKRKMNYTAK